MTGLGLVSVRLPKTLIERVREKVREHGLSIHALAREMVAALPSLTSDDILSLQEPPRESDPQRITFNVSWGLIDILSDFTQDKRLTNSAIFRRVLYGLVVERTVEFVQRDGQWELLLVSNKSI